MTTPNGSTPSPPPQLEEQDFIPIPAPVKNPSTPELGDDACTDPCTVPLPTSQSASSSTPTSLPTNSLRPGRRCSCQQSHLDVIIPFFLPTMMLNGSTPSPPPQLEEQDFFPIPESVKNPSTPELGDDARTDPSAIPLPTSQYDSSSTPTLSPTNSLTPEPHLSSEPDSIEPTILSPVAPEEFPNPFDNIPIKPFARTRSVSTMTQLLPNPEPQPPHPSVLRPSHPRAFHSVRSRPSSLALSTLEFEEADPRLSWFDPAASWEMHRPTLSEPQVVSPIAGDDQEERVLRSSQSFYHGDGAPPGLSPGVPWRRASSLIFSHVPSPTGDHDDTQPQIEVSERRDVGQFDSLPDLAAAKLQKPKSGGRTTLRWKFWMRGGKKQKA